MTESREMRIRRLIYRSSYTGMRETDKLLRKFASFLELMSDAELDAYEDLLGYGDEMIWRWVSGQTPIPQDFDNAALKKLVLLSQDSLNKEQMSQEQTSQEQTSQEQISRDKRT